MEEEIKQKVRTEFESISSGSEYREFFIRYPFLSTNDIAQIVGLSSRIVRKIKNKAGIRRDKVRAPVPTNIQVPKIVDLPVDWDTPAWWRDNYPKYGTWTLSRVTGLSIPVVRNRINKYCDGGILSHHEATKSSHPCCNEAWVRDNYLGENLSARACARLANVSVDTFIGWLNRFNIQVKSNGRGPSVGKVPGV